MERKNFKEIYLKMTPEEREQERKLLEGNIGYYALDAFLSIFSQKPTYAEAKDQIVRGNIQRLEILTEVMGQS